MEADIAGCFCQIYSKNLEQKPECKHLKNLQFGHRRDIFKIETKEGIDAEEISATKEKPVGLYQNNRKDASGNHFRN